MCYGPRDCDDDRRRHHTEITEYGPTTGSYVVMLLTDRGPTRTYVTLKHHLRRVNDPDIDHTGH